MAINSSERVSTSLPASSKGAVTVSSQSSLRDLEPGQILNVEVAQDARGDAGVLIRGQFFRATLSENYPPGQKLTVQVTDTREILVLKVLTASVGTGETAPAPPLQALLQSIFPDLNINDLKQSMLAGKVALPDELTRLLKDANSATLDKLAQAFERYLFNQVLLSPEGLKDPETIEALLKHLTEKSILDNVGDAKTVLQNLAKSTLSEAHVKLLETLEEQISNLLSSKTPLSFDAKGSGDTASLPEQLKLYLRLAQFATSNGSAASLEEIAKNISSLKLQGNQLLVILAGVKSLDFSSLDSASLPEKAFVELLRNFVGDLQDLKNGKVSDKEIRALLQKSLAAFRDEFPKDSRSLAQAGALDAGMKTLKAVENLAASQQVLNQINPLMQLFGEPALIFVPALMQGLLSKLEMTVSRDNSPLVDGKDGGKKGNRSGFERVQLFFPLPHIGDVGVELAHRPGELYLNLTFSNEKVTEFVKSKLPKLDKSLDSYGYGLRTINAMTGTPRGVTPDWYQNLVRNSVIA